MDPFENSESSPALRNDNNQNYPLNQTQNWNLPGLKNKAGNNSQEADIFPEILIGVFVGGVFIIIIVILYMAFRTQLKIILANRKWNKNNPEEKTDEVDTTNVEGTGVSFNESQNKYYSRPNSIYVNENSENISMEDFNSIVPNQNENGVILNINKLEEDIPYIDERPNSIYISQSSENIFLQDSNDQILSEIKSGDDGTDNKGFVSEENNEEKIQKDIFIDVSIEDTTPSPKGFSFFRRNK